MLHRFLSQKALQLFVKESPKLCILEEEHLCNILSAEILHYRHNQDSVVSAVVALQKAFRARTIKENF